MSAWRPRWRADASGHVETFAGCWACKPFTDSPSWSGSCAKAQTAARLRSSRSTTRPENPRRGAVADLSPREQIRDEAIRAITETIRTDHRPTEIGNVGGGYNCVCGEPWLERLFKGCQTRHRAESVAARAVDALAAAGLLPTGVEEQLVGGFQPGIHTFEDIKDQSYPPTATVRRYTTDWVEVSE